jgi:poly(glycerol-phosphate) alpha-glucosyltransferase
VRLQAQRLPTGRHFAVTWGIPDSYGGMTTALLQRSRAFARLGGVSVDVLTFEAGRDYDEVRARLRKRGELIDGVRLLNLYEWLREHPLPGGTLRLDRDVFAPLADVRPAPPDASRCRFRDVSPSAALLNQRVTEDGTVLQVDHYREDGTLLLSDRRDTRLRGRLGGRSIVLCDERGVPVRSWARIHHLYRAWLDALTAKQRSFLIVDSKTSANFMLDYRRSHAITAHVVHNSHLASADEPLGEVRASRRAVFERLDDFDIVAVLSERQRRDIVAARGAHPGLSVIANPRAPVPRGPRPRDPRGGIVLASLTARKRVDHAVRVAARSGVRLDVFGDGDRMDAVRAAIPAGTGHRIRLHGHRPDARRRLPRASFLLQTAASEGFPLVLAEAMAAGTLPIAYDVPYGPADLIDDGWNGMLVPSGDEAALAAAVTRLASMPAPRIARMRRAARKTARDYTERAVVDAWATAFDLALERRAEGASSDQASTRSSSSFAARTQPRSASSSRSAARASLTEANSNEPEATRAPVASAMR